MAITEVPEYAHLSDADLEELADGLEAIRRDVEASRGAKDRAYIMRAIAFQRCLEIAARLAIARTKGKFGWAVGTAALAAAKCIENMELGHNISHGQWDWMNDPEIHSNVWEWDMAGLTSQWRNSHNYRHHMYANVVGVDDDLGEVRDDGLGPWHRPPRALELEDRNGEFPGLVSRTPLDVLVGGYQRLMAVAHAVTRDQGDDAG